MLSGYPPPWEEEHAVRFRSRPQEPVVRAATQCSRCGLSGCTGPWVGGGRVSDTPAGRRGAGYTGVASPQRLLERDDLSRAEKIALLREWELDLRERMVADDENMPSAEPMPVTLDDVLRALESLGEAPQTHPVPTRHG